MSIEPAQTELPSQFADRLGAVYASAVSQKHKKEQGQFFTPVEIASLMATYSDFEGDAVRILDPGCGSAVLCCALVEHLVHSNKDLKQVDLVAYETDADLIPFSKRALQYLKEWAGEKGVEIHTTLYKEDFVLHKAGCFDEVGNLFARPTDLFDIVISNPPYFKLSIDDKRVKVAKVVVNGHPNIYAIFMALAAKLLADNGELIFITPRSYAAGRYFKAFREYFFKRIDLEKVHLFVSRKETFSRDKVLQETLIIKGTKTRHPKPRVLISSSEGIKDLHAPHFKTFAKHHIIDIHSKEKILYLPTSEYEEKVLNIFRSWTGKLAKYGINISTGPVVAFRCRDHISEYFENGSVKVAPLYWLHNVKQMALEWPVHKKSKGQYIRMNEKSAHVLIPNRNYVLLRRFSSKDDKHRLVAAPYFASFSSSKYIGVENKVNYIYRANGQLDSREVIGLCALLNSRLFDTYFRIFNGNVNVSATELREMPLPPLEIIHLIGDTIKDLQDFSLEKINEIVNRQLEPTYQP